VFFVFLYDHRVVIANEQLDARVGGGGARLKLNELIYNAQGLTVAHCLLLAHSFQTVWLLCAH